MKELYCVLHDGESYIIRSSEDHWPFGYVRVGRPYDTHGEAERALHRHADTMPEEKP